MSWFSDIGGFLTETVPSLFGGSGGTGKSILDGILTPQSVVSALTGVGSYLTKQDAGNSALDLQKLKGEQETALSDKTFEQQVELLKLKQALGGGGGGSGSGAAAAALAYEKQRDRRNRIMAAMQSGQQSQQDSSTLTISALRNLAQAAQAPLGRVGA